MKSVLVNFGIIFIVLAMYFTGFFGWFTNKYVLWAAIGVIIMLFIAAFKILGNPWAGK